MSSTDSELHKQVRDLIYSVAIYGTRPTSTSGVAPARAVEQLMHLIARSNQVAALDARIDDLVMHVGAMSNAGSRDIKDRLQQLQQALDALKKEPK